MKKILFLGSDPGTIDMIHYAKSIDMYTIVADWFDAEHSEAKREADDYWVMSYAEVDALEEKCRDESVEAVMAASSEFATGIMIELCERLGLPCYISKKSFSYEKNKAEFKKICKLAGVPVPKDYKISRDMLEEELELVEFPVVVKPVDQCGSKGVTYCNNKEELIQACKKAREISDNPEIVVEQKIEGREFAAYYALADGEISLLFLHSELAANKNMPGACFATSNVTDSVEKFVETVNESVINALKLCGCREHVAWVQMIQDKDGKFYVFELGYRLGADLAPFEYINVGDLDLAKWGVECALGMQHTREELPQGLTKKMDKFFFTYMLCCVKSGIVKEIRGLQTLKRCKKINILLDVCVGDALEAWGKSIGHVGFYADTEEEICDMLEWVNEELHILNEENEEMILHYMTANRFREEEGLSFY